MAKPDCTPDKLNEDILDNDALGGIKLDMVKGLFRNCWNLPLGIEGKKYENLRENNSIFHWEIVLEILLLLSYFQDGLRGIGENISKQTTFEKLWQDMSESRVKLQIKNFFYSISPTEKTYNRFEDGKKYNAFQSISSVNLSYSFIRSMLQILSNPLFFQGRCPIVTNGPYRRYRIEEEYQQVFSRFREFALKGNIGNITCADCKIPDVPSVVEGDFCKMFLEKAIPILQDKIIDYLKHQKKARLPAIRQEVQKIQATLETIIQQQDLENIVKKSSKVKERVMEVITGILSAIKSDEDAQNFRNICLLYEYFCKKRVEA